MKRLFGIFLITSGALILLVTLIWLAVYLVNRGLDTESLRASFSSELGYWAPVGLLGAPGIILLYHGQRLLRGERLSIPSLGEVLIIFAIMGIITAMVLPMDNFSYVAASIVADGMKTAAPVQTAVEKHYSRHGRFPDSVEQLEEPLPNLTAKHVRSITIGKSGQIIITFDTRDIDWGWSPWHRLLFLEPNDLTDQTLLLAPSTANDEIVWDECTQGTVPKHNRHFKCSGHK